MKSLPYVFLFAIAGSLNLPAQTPSDSIQISGCAQFWANQFPINHFQLSVAFSSAFQQGPTFTGDTDPDSPCSAVNVPAQLATQYAYFTPGGQVFDLPNDYRSGLSVSDLVCINLHILGLEPLSNFALFAADANGSHTITGFDILELRKLLLGIYTELPTAPAWRTIPAYAMFLNPTMPFGNAGLEIPSDSLSNFDGDTIPFMVVKVGDVNGDYSFPGSVQPAVDSLELLVSDPTVQAADTVLVPFRLGKAFGNGWTNSGLQFACRFDTSRLAFVRAWCDKLPFDQGTSWTVSPDEGLIRSLVFNPAIATFMAGDTLVYFQFVAKTPGILSEALQLDTLALRPLYTQSCSQTGALLLHFEQASGLSPLPTGVRVWPPQPNPYASESSLRVQLQRQLTLRLEIRDLTGRLTHCQAFDLPPGEHRLPIPASALQRGALGVYRLFAGSAFICGKLVRM